MDRTAREQFPAAASTTERIGQCAPFSYESGNICHPVCERWFLVSMNFPDENGIEFDEQAISLHQTAKATEAHHDHHRQWIPSDTFVLSNNTTTATTTTTTVPTYWEPHSKSSRYDLSSTVTFPDSSKLSPEVTDGFIATAPPSALPNEAFFTVVSLEGTSPKTAPRSYLFDFNAVANPKTGSVLHPSIYDQPTFEKCALFEETSTAAILTTRSPTSPSLLPVARGTVASERKRIAASDPIAMRDNLLYRLQRILAKQRKPMLNLLLPLCLLIGIMMLIYAFWDTAKGVLFWIETQNTWIIFVIFLCMFTIVSFPVTVGYLVLIIASGYLFGFVRGLLTVLIGANLGVAIAHNTIKSLQSKLPVHKLIKNETGRAILRVISGPRAFKIVLFARLTPIPFGLQNTIFGISSVNTRSYHAGTVIGLLPAQTINVYLGSKLRSIHEVLNDHNAALGLAGYGVFAVEMIVGIALMIWVVQKARLELSAALLTSADSNSDEKILIEIEA
uniref:VTT domain-containing protein n=1 Tax=Anopheles culicifacies TaxID=139723 RepID=A0A182MGN8_9DIPT